MKNWFFYLLLVALVITPNLQSSLAAPQLVPTVSINVKGGEKEGTTNVTITGRITDSFNNAVQGATVSLQLADPGKTSLHTSVTQSKADGSYSEAIIIAKPMSGNYTLYLTASKIGYDDKKLNVPFALVSGDFDLKITPTSRTMVQGSNASFEIAMVPLLGDSLPPISVKIIGLPQRVTYNLLNKSATTPKILTLTLITREDTPAGRYNFTLIGESKGYSHVAWAVIEIAEAAKRTTEPAPRTSEPSVKVETPIPSIALPMVIVVLGIAASALLLRRLKILRTTKPSYDESIPEPSQDREYLAVARALTRLEELRATEKLDEETYKKLRREYEEKLEKTRRKS